MNAMSQQALDSAGQLVRLAILGRQLAEAVVSGDDRLALNALAGIQQLLNTDVPTEPRRSVPPPSPVADGTLEVVTSTLFLREAFRLICGPFLAGSGTVFKESFHYATGVRVDARHV